MKKVHCPTCGSEISAPAIDEMTKKIIKENLPPGDEYLGIIKFDEAQFDETYYFCPVCEMKFTFKEVREEYRNGTRRS